MEIKASICTTLQLDGLRGNGLLLLLLVSRRATPSSMRSSHSPADFVAQEVAVLAPSFLDQYFPLQASLHSALPVSILPSTPCEVVSARMPYEKTG
jgi:hypothetical protein